MNNNNEIIFRPIGIIHSPFTAKIDMPVQPAAAKGIKGSVILKDEFVPGLKDIDGFSHIILIYQFHLSEGFSQEVIPFLDNKHHGVFATRAPKRPNQVGISVVKLINVTNNVLHIENIDVIDNTPLIDIKPYVGCFDFVENERDGWLNNKAHIAVTKSDERF